VRRLTLIPLDDLLVVVREFINPAISRSGLDRCLRRHGVGSLRALQAAALEAAGETPPAKTFKDYEPGFVHIDIKYLTQMPDEAARRYLFAAIDRAARWVFLRVSADQSEASSVDLLERLHRAAPMKITQALTATPSADQRPGGALQLAPQRGGEANPIQVGRRAGATLTAYCKTHNHHIPQRSLDHRSPMQALQASQVSKPYLFKRAACK